MEKSEVYSETRKVKCIELKLAHIDGHMLTHLRQGNGEASNSTSTVAYGLSLDIPVCSDPVQNLLNSLIMTSSDIHLDRVDFITFRVNFVPAVESFSVEIFPDLRFVVHTRLKGCNMLSVLHRRNERRSSCDNKGQKGNQCLHSANDVVQHLVQNDNVRRTIVAIRKKDESNLGDRRRTRKIQVERKDATYRQRTNATSTSIEFRIRLFSLPEKYLVGLGLDAVCAIRDTHQFDRHETCGGLYGTRMCT